MPSTLPPVPDGLLPELQLPILLTRLLTMALDGGGYINGTMEQPASLSIVAVVRTAVPGLDPADGTAVPATPYA